MTPTTFEEPWRYNDQEAAMMRATGRSAGIHQEAQTYHPEACSPADYSLIVTCGQAIRAKVRDLPDFAV